MQRYIDILLRQVSEKKTFILMLCFLSVVSNCYSQVGAKINGTILDRNTSKPIEFASVVLENYPDSTLVKGTTTDTDGNFGFKNITTGKYIIISTFIGYKKSKSKVFEVDETINVIKLGKLYLSESAQSLKEVEIISQKSTFTSSIDRKTYRVGDDVMSSAGSVSDIMQNIPTIQVDVIGNVSIRGSSDITFLINGKPAEMLKNNPGTTLQQMPANLVEKIEIITNPSSKYKPDGTGGIINIVMKKNKSIGLNGYVNVSIGNEQRYNGGTILNYNLGKLNLFGNYNFRQDDYKRLSDSYTQTLQNGVEISNLINSSNSHSRPVTNMMGIGADYTLNNKNNLSATVNYSHIYQSRDEYSNFKKDSVDITLKDFSRNRRPPKLETNLDPSVRFQHKFEKDGHELNINFSNSNYTESTDNYFTNIYRFPVSKFNLDNVFYRHNILHSQLLIDYTNPFSKKTILEAGYQFDDTKNEMKINRDTISTNQFEPSFVDYSRTTHFLHDEFTHSLYLSYRREFGKFGLSAGLRGETTFTRSNTYSEKLIIRNQYSRLYPSLHTLYKVSEHNELQLNYSRRIRRPSDEQLNPFPQYLDMLNIPLGNPYLKPEDIHSIELSYGFKNQSISFLSTLYYRYTLNGITTITKAHGDTLISTLQNLSKNQATGLEIILSSSIGKRIKMTLSSNTFYNVIDASALGYSKNQSNITFTAKANLSINLFENTLWQITSNYTSERLTPQGVLLPTFVLNSGIKQNLFKKKGAIILTISDVFNSLNSNLIIDTPELQRQEYRKRSARVIYLSFTLSFGSNGKKEKENNLQYDNKL